MISQATDPWSTIANWAEIAGRWSFSGADARYLGPSTTGLARPYGLALSDAELRDGVVRANMQLQAPKSSASSATNETPLKGASGGILLGYQSETSNYLVAGLGAFDTAYAIWEFEAGFGWRPQATAGSIENLQPNVQYALEVTLRGQRITLVVNNVRVLDHVLPRPLTGNQLGLFAFSPSPISFQGVEVMRRQPRAFVAMPFSEPFDTFYRHVIRPKAQSLGFDVIRIDEKPGPGIIFEDIKREIEDAKVVIAEITAPNQNVFYELGYAHALNKPTILLAQRGRELPFDIRSYRVIFYDDTIGGKPAVERALREHLRSILRDI